MKRKYQIFLIGILTTLFIASCDSTSERSKVLSPIDENYLTENEFDQKPEFADQNDYKNALETISKSLNENVSTSVLAADVTFEAFVFVNEKGSVDKVFVIEAPAQKVVELISKELMKMKFEPALKDDNPVPARFKFRYNINAEFDQDLYFVAVEEMPSPVGGIEAIAKNVVYPEIAKRAGIEGRVFVKAYIDTNGNVANAEIIKGIGAGCDEAAIEAVKKTKFTPGKQRGKKVNVQVSIPIMFKLQ